MELGDLIGKTLDGYVQLESAKIQSRLSQTNEQATAYDNPTFSAQVNNATQAAAGSKWLMLAGLVGVGLVVYLAVK